MTVNKFLRTEFFSRLKSRPYPISDPGDPLPFPHPSSLPHTSSQQLACGNGWPQPPFRQVWRWSDARWVARVAPVDCLLVCSRLPADGPGADSRENVGGAWQRVNLLTLKTSLPCAVSHTPASNEARERFRTSQEGPPNDVIRIGPDQTRKAIHAKPSTTLTLRPPTSLPGTTSPSLLWCAQSECLPRS